MNSIIIDIINSFESTSKTKTSRYKDFLAYVYKTFEDKINYSREKKIKNKYKKMRLSILEYIVINKKEIKSKICKSK
jgi:CRISPR/Cas system CSM-associated protein Csm2 small subunit